MKDLTRRSRNQTRRSLTQPEKLFWRSNKAAQKAEIARRATPRRVGRRAAEAAVFNERQKRCELSTAE